MPQLWIVHREPRIRAAIARLAGASDEAVVGAPGDPLFDSAPAPDVVLLGLSGDFEVELEFARRVTLRHPAGAWILLVARRMADSVRRLFDTLSAQVVDYPPDPHALRAMIREAALRRGGPEPLPLSRRPAREELAARFARWFSDLDLPELLRALDPKLADVPLLVRGEPGTGRGILVRYVHAFGGTAGGELVVLPCTETTRPEDLLDTMAAASRSPRALVACTLWLEDVDRLPTAIQRLVRGWIEHVPPEGAVRSARVRWIASASDDGPLDPGLRRALSGLTVRIPPLRERLELVPNLANGAAAAWCDTRGQRPRRFGEHALAVLEEYPWPGNLQELESVVAQSLAAGTADPLGVEDLRMDGVPLAPLDASAVGTLLEAEDVEGLEPVEDVEVLPELEPEPMPPIPVRAAVERARAVAAEELPAAEEEPPAAEEELPAAEEEPPAAEEEPPAAAAGAEAAPGGVAPAPDPLLRRLAGVLDHEVRNPLTTIRSFTELLPERYADTGFRTRFGRLVGEGVDRVEQILARVRQLASLAPPERKAVDVSGLIEEILDGRRERIRERNLLVLKELDTDRPQGLCDPEQIRFALEALVDRSLGLLPERGDLYLASRHHPTGLRGRPSLRVLLRLQGPRAGPAPEGVSEAENALEFAIAEAIVRAQDGELAIHAGDAGETVVILDLPAPAE
jgi:two-component system response regulator PilR (NtrC family)